MTKFSKIAALVATTALSAGFAQAGTITSETFAGSSASGEFLFIDVYNHETGLWVGEEGFVGDGQTDLSYGENPGQNPSARVGAVAGQDFGDQQVNFLIVTDSNFSLSDNASGAATDFTGQATFGSDDLTGKFLNGSGELYDAQGNGPLGGGGSGIFGFVMSALDTTPTVTPVCDFSLDIELPSFCFDEGEGEGEGEIVSDVTFEEGGEGETGSNVLAEYFGFIQLSRGSVIGGTFGVNTTSGSAVALPQMSQVPLPASVLLLGAGIAGLGFAGRRRKKA